MKPSGKIVLQELFCTEGLPFTISLPFFSWPSAGLKNGAKDRCRFDMLAVRRIANQRTMVLRKMAQPAGMGTGWLQARKPNATIFGESAAQWRRKWWTH
jgi:hypothetical protein